MVDSPSDKGDLGSGTWLSQQGGKDDVLRIRKCRLEVTAGPDKGKSETLASPHITIGRAGASLELSDKKVSHLHAEIHLEPRGYRLRDLGSTNGTFVWGMNIVEGFIGPGSTLVLGDSAVRFVPLADSVDAPLSHDAKLCGLVGQSAPMRQLFHQIRQVAASDATVLITGETGTGKELVAEAIHETSPRSEGPFVVLDCGAVPAHLFEDQLFGHRAGSFTGATRSTVGVFEAAHGGTLLLDEIGELPLEVQSKLLRAVETRSIKPIGSDQTIECDVRLVAATNRDLPSEMNAGAFRRDLYFRLAVASVRVPPLRDRKEDIEILVAHFRSNTAWGQNSTATAKELLPWARKYPWPGNVRELRNAVEQALTLGSAPEVPAESDLEANFQVDIDVPFRDAKKQVVDRFERLYVTALLDANDWNLSAAARAAGLDRMSIYKLLSRLGLSGGRPK